VNLVGAGVLGQESKGTGLQRGKDPGIVGVRGEDDHAGLGLFLAQPLGGLDPVAARHVQVHQDDVGAQLAGLADGVVAVDGRTDHLDARQQSDERDEPFPDDLLVIGYEHPDRRARR